MTLADFRKEAGYPSAAKAAARLGISTIHLYNCEEGSRGASDDLIGRMAALYDVPEASIRREIRRAKKALLERALKEMA